MPILTDQERIGTLLGGRYRIDAILGRGGMGVVFKAHRDDDRLPVAVKILRPELAQTDPQFAKRFVREARAAAAIRHPNVVEILDIDEDDDGTIYQVLELLVGESLRDHLQRKGRLSVGLTLELLLPVMHALEAAHLAGIVHRDLKPDNIFLSRQPSGEAIPTLLDFGIAKLLDTRGGSFATNTGSIMGTPAYMAPEQASGARDQGPAIDVWAMGIIAYECLTGDPPFSGTSPAHVMLRIMTETPRSIDLVDPELPATVARVVDRALARAPLDRHPGMAAFRAALRTAAAEAGVELPAEGRASTTRVVSIIPTADRVHDEEANTADGNDSGAGVATMARELRNQRAERAKADAATQLASPKASSPREGGYRGAANDSIDVAIEAPVAAPRPRWPIVVALIALLLVGAGGLGLALRSGDGTPAAGAGTAAPPPTTSLPEPPATTAPPPVAVAATTDPGPATSAPPSVGVDPPAAAATEPTGPAVTSRGRGPRGRRDPATQGAAATSEPASSESSMTTTMETRGEDRRGRGLPSVVEW